MLKDTEKIWEESLKCEPNLFIESYMYSLGIIKKKLNITYKLKESNSHTLPTFITPHLFESFLEEDQYAYYLKVPYYLIESNDNTKTNYGLPIVSFNESYSSDHSLLSFNLLDGNIKEDIVKVAVIKEAVLNNFSNQISRIIRRTSDERIKHGTEWARAKLVDVTFNPDPDQITYRWRTEPTEKERKEVQVGDKDMPITSTRNVSRGAVATVPDISKSGYVSSPVGTGRTVNFTSDTAYIMELQFTADPQWKKTSYVKINKAQVDDMIEFGLVRFFCSCPHFNWGGIAYNLTQEDASIQPQQKPAPHWNPIHGRPHKLCKHLRNLLKGFKIWENKIVSITRKLALEKKIDY